VSSNEVNSIDPADHDIRPRYVGLTTRMAVALVVVLGLFAALQAPEATQNYGVTVTNPGWTVLVLFLVSLTNVGVARFILLPAVARRPDAAPDSVAFMGYAFAVTPSIYGLIAVILSGEGWMSLPFSLLSLLAVVDLRLYFARAIERSES
jgi:hypothetical protein